MIAYSKQETGNTIIVCVNLDAKGAREGLVVVPDELALPASFPATDLLTGKRFAWKTGGNYVSLDPGQAHLLRV